MVLSGLVLLPVFAIPTLLNLKKDFQIKLFFGLVGLIHFFFTVGLLGKYGYLFEGDLFIESIPLYADLGLSYTLGLSSETLCLVILINFFYLFFGSLSLNGLGGSGAVVFCVAQPLLLISLLSSNVLLVGISLFLYLLIYLFLSMLTQKRLPIFSLIFLFIGLVFSLGMNLMFGILYESVFSSVNLNVLALSEMRTPFVRGSLFSTQFVLFLFYLVGFLSYCFVALMSSIKASKNSGNFVDILSVLGLMVLLYKFNEYLKILFPEAAKNYLPSADMIKTVSVIFLLFVLSFLVFSRIGKIVKQRTGHV